MPDVFSDQTGGPDVPDSAATTGRALVPLTLTAAAADCAPANIRSDARFVTHLIAAAIQAPQTRHRQRAAVGDAMTSYADAKARDRLPIAANGSALSKVA